MLIDFVVAFLTALVVAMARFQFRRP